jgi:hypothetical protein
MAQTAAMVQAKVVKAGGGGAPLEMDCDAIFACFDPPIEMGPHEEMAKSVAWQAEHVPPCSNFHVKGRGGAKIPGCENFSTAKAMTWLVEDGQKLLKEHQQLTKAMREFSKVKGDKTLKQWMDKYQEAATDVLKKRKVKPHAKHLDKDDLAAKAAECIREKVDKSFEGKVDQNTLLRNGQAQGKPPAAPAKGPAVTGKGSGSGAI